MTIEEIKKTLIKLESLSFILPNGSLVPAHFHITEVGKITKDFIDCGGKRRTEEKACFQLWHEEADDHRLAPQKLMRIIDSSQQQLNLGDLAIVVEYQGRDSISQYGLEYDGMNFLLTSLTTACLAMDQCGVPEEKTLIEIGSDSTNSNCCTPGGACC